MHRTSRISAEDFTRIAWILVDRHGADALWWADQAIDELDAKNDSYRAGAWRTLKSVVEDALEGRLARTSSVCVH